MEIKVYNITKEKVPVLDLVIPSELKEEWGRINSTYFGVEDEEKRASELFLLSIKIKKYLGNDFTVLDDWDKTEIFYPMRVRLMPDFSEALFWDENKLSCCIGGSYGFYSIVFPEDIKKRLASWYGEFEELGMNYYDLRKSVERKNIKELDFSSITKEAIEICKMIKNEYKDLIEIKYWEPFEDPSCDYEDEIIEIS